MKRCSAIFLVFLALLSLSFFEQATPPAPVPTNLTARLKVPAGFVVELVAGPPLVRHPMMANFDERGRLFLAESSGLNLRAPDLLKQLPNKVLLLDAADAKGRFTKSQVFADRMTFPSGALPYQGSVYVTAAPHIWKLRDTKNVGVADVRVELVSKFNFIGNAADIHGPFLGPDGRIYWCDGRHGHDITRPDGTTSKGKAARIFRCKPDGSDVEVVCGGGMDNPVEIAFTDEAEPLVTVDILHNFPSRNDGIIYAIEGGNYPWHDAHKELPRTGDLLPAIENLGWVAPSGLMRYRSDALGQAYRGNLFSAQFNRHRIQRHILERAGASFKIKTEDFLTTDDKNFHPTDVFEDADGSLLVIDTGGWFRIGCPTSKIAQPDILGAIYRVRKADAKPIDDPRGLKIAWDSLTPTALIPLLDDPRFAVRDRAIEELARRGDKALPALEKAIDSERSATLCRGAVWALTRIDNQESRRLVRRLINDRDLSVKLAALHSVGLNRDAAALLELKQIPADEHPAVLRQAATALGRLPAADSVATLMSWIERTEDRFLEHAIIHALIQRNDRQTTATYFNRSNPRLKRAALIAIDQMRDGSLTRAEWAGTLKSDHKPLVKSALEILAVRPKWAEEIVGLLRQSLAETEPTAMSRDTLQGLLVALSNETAIQEMIVHALADAKTPRSARLLLVEAIGRAPLAKLPPAWSAAVGKTLTQADDAIIQQGLTVIRSRGLTQFDDALNQLVHDSARAAETRVRAFAVVSGRLAKTDERAFEFLLTQLHADRPPLQRLAAAQGLAHAKLDGAQLQRLAKSAASAGPLELPALVSAFEKNASGEVGRVLVDALAVSPGFAGLTPTALEKASERWPTDVRAKAAKLIERLRPDAAKQSARLDELQPLIAGGTLEQGRDLFFGNKASCSACHAVNNRGGGVGPDLGKIGAIRSGRDLLEAIVFPSSSFARGFESYIVETKRGLSFTGILGRETSEAIVLITPERTEIRIPREEIDTFLPARVSIMPQGLDAQLTRRELQDLLAYLQSLR